MKQIISTASLQELLGESYLQEVSLDAMAGTAEATLTFHDPLLARKKQSQPTITDFYHVVANMKRLLGAEMGYHQYRGIQSSIVYHGSLVRDTPTSALMKISEVDRHEDVCTICLCLTLQQESNNVKITSLIQCSRKS